MVSLSDDTLDADTSAGGVKTGTGKDIDKKQSVSMALQESVAVIPYVQLTNYSPVRRSDRSSALVDLSDDASGDPAPAAVAGFGVWGGSTRI